MMHTKAQLGIIMVFSLKNEDTSWEQFKRLLKTVLFERAYL